MRLGPELPLYHSPSNLSIGKLYKKSDLKSPIIVQHYHLHFGSKCDRILVSRGESEDYFPRPLKKKNEKNLLTNRTECAIMSMSRGEGNRNQAWQWWNRNPQKTS
jgi:hypothetical protein